MIQLERVSHHYNGGALRRQVLFDVSTTIAAGEIVLLTGPSGSGKSTLLTLVGALRSGQTGDIRVLGEQLRNAPPSTLIRVRRQIGYIFQKHNLLASLTALENVQLSLATRGEGDRHDARRRAAEMLEIVGLGEHLRHTPRQLSGGQQQRVAIARALAGRPRLILADEPTAALDSASGAEVANHIRALARQQGCAALVVTHDARITRIADRVLHIEDGRLSGQPAERANGGRMVGSQNQFKASQLSEDL